MDTSQLASDAWIPDLKNLCYDFLRNVQKRPGGRFLRFNEDNIGDKNTPGKIVREYRRTAIEYKLHIFGDAAGKSHIDHHKIAALYIRSFLKYRLFDFDIPDETKYFELCLNTKLANEYFAVVYLSVIFKGWKNEFADLLRIEPIYKFNFIKLLHRYKNQIDKLDPLALSNIIYLIEQHYFQHSELF